jgi:TonB family protein
MSNAVAHYSLKKMGSKDLELDPGTRRSVFFSVLTGHFFFLALPFLISFIIAFLPAPKPERVISVKLIDEPKSSAKIKNLAPPVPDMPTPLPPEEAAPPPPKEQIQPVKKTITETPPTPVKVPVEKKTTPSTKEWKPRPPDKITVSKKVIKASTPPQKTNFNADDFKKKLMKIQSQCKVSGDVSSTKNNDVSPGDTSSSRIPEYYERVSAFLYDIWNQPSKAELKGVKPTVSLFLKVDSSGKILSSSITRPSGISPMDASVNELLKTLDSIPPPPTGAMTLNVSLEVTD